MAEHPLAGEEILGPYRVGTVRQYAEIGEVVAEDESVRLGLFDSGAAAPTEWSVVTKARSEEILSKIQTVIQYHGGAQGRMHALFMAEGHPYFRFRDLASGDLVKCVFRRDMYGDVAAALEATMNNPETVIYLSGTFTAQRFERKVQSVVLQRIKVAEAYRKGDLEKFFGCAPNLTGDLSTEEFIRRLRDDDH